MDTYSKRLRYLYIVLIGLTIGVCAPIFVLQVINAYDQRTPSGQELPDIQLFPLGDCTAACWQGLQPGIATESDVRQVLENPPFRISLIDSDYNGSTLIYAEHDAGYFISAVISDGKLFSLSIGARWLRMTLGEIIAALGEPDYELIFSLPGSQLRYLETNSYLYYPLLGFEFHLRDSDLADTAGITSTEIQSGEIEVCLSEQAVVSRVVITQTGSIEDVLDYINFPSIRMTWTADQLGEWSGLGCRILPQR